MTVFRREAVLSRIGVPGTARVEPSIGHFLGAKPATNELLR